MAPFERRHKPDSKSFFKVSSCILGYPPQIDGGQVVIVVVIIPFLPLNSGDHVCADVAKTAAGKPRFDCVLTSKRPSVTSRPYPQSRRDSPTQAEGEGLRNRLQSPFSQHLGISLKLCLSATASRKAQKTGEIERAENDAPSLRHGWEKDGLIQQLLQPLGYCSRGRHGWVTTGHKTFSCL